MGLQKECNFLKLNYKAHYVAIKITIKYKQADYFNTAVKM